MSHFSVSNPLYVVSIIYAFYHTDQSLLLLIQKFVLNTSLLVQVSTAIVNQLPDQLVSTQTEA